MIAVIDYGMGNLRSVAKALEEIGAKIKITSSANVIRKASKIVFPGVGSFYDGLKELSKRGLIKPIKSAIRDKKPFLGLCLGLQLLFEESQEAPNIKGLGILEGKIKRIPPEVNRKRLKVPHIGWNQIHLTKRGKESRLFRGIKDGSFVYFVHSYVAIPEDSSIISTITEYGIKFCSSISKDNIYATQFHPEKSQEVGLKILKNFIEI